MSNQKKLQHSPHRQILRLICQTSASLALGIQLISGPVFAADPFQSQNPQPIGNQTEAAFKAWFIEGNYKQAEQLINQALVNEPNEPLAYAIKTSLAYLLEDWGDVNLYATKTREAGEKLIQTNPLRGNIYTAAGHFLEGAYLFTQNGTVKGTPQALAKLQKVYQYLDTAEKIAPQDPELNLIKGYMDLMLSSYLPFAEAGDAINRLQNYAQPRYLAYRGIGLGYRNLKQYDKAISFLNSALQTSPNNPELHYLKAQILFLQEKHQQAQPNFEAALAKPEQLPKNLAQQIYFEKCRNLNRIDNKPRNCDGLRDKITDTPGVWTPAQLPSLD